MIGAIFGVSLIVAVPVSFGVAFGSGDWRYLIITAIACGMLWSKQ